MKLAAPGSIVALVLVEFTYRAKLWQKGRLPDEGEERTRTVRAVNLIGRR